MILDCDIETMRERVEEDGNTLAKSLLDLVIKLNEELGDASLSHVK